MSPTTQETYLANQVLTASPVKLRLMLIDGALRFAQSAKQHWQNDQMELAEETMSRCRQIAAELMRSAAVSEEPVAKRICGVYAFLIRTLTEARQQQEQAKLDDVIRVLQAEQETWRAVSAKFGGNSLSSGADSIASLFPESAIDVFADGIGQGGLSLDA